MREPDVKVAARELGVPVIIQPTSLKDEMARDALVALEPDILVVAAYGKILPKAVLVLPKRGSLNVHASLLPRWRGASPIEAAILAGDPETGVTIMEVVQKMDAGPMVAVRTATIDPDDTTGLLEQRLAELGASLLVDCLPGWFDGTTVARSQDEDAATYCTLIRKEHGQIRIDTTAEQAERMVRAFNPWPGASIGYGDERLTIWRAHISGDEENGTPSELSSSNGELRLALEGGWISLDEVQRPGGKRLAARDFLNGEKGRGGLKARATLA
jgi:methionyl-tRNA formyltransferase